MRGATLSHPVLVLAHLELPLFCVNFLHSLETKFSIKEVVKYRVKFEKKTTIDHWLTHLLPKVSHLILILEGKV